jgi:L-lactate dehydrogenase complex protein LldF
VKINIPEILIHLRGKVVENGDAPFTERMAMKTAAYFLENADRLANAQKLARVAQLPFVRRDTISRLPGKLAGWTAVRDLAPVPKQSFREWWAARRQEKQQ